MPFANTVISLRGQDDLTRQRGEWLKLFVGSLCPCGVELGRPDFACPNCNGLGHFHPDPPQDMCSIISEIDLKRDPFGIPGFCIPGDLVMSVRPARGKLPEVNDWDMIMPTWPQGVPQEGEGIIADPSGIDGLQYPIVELFSAYGLDPNNTAGVNLVVKYVPGVDFTTVPATGTQLYPQSIQWLTSNRPAPGAKYVVKYSYQPQLICFFPPKLHIERGDDLGRTCLLRKRSIIISNGGVPSNQ